MNKAIMMALMLGAGGALAAGTAMTAQTAAAPAAAPAAPLASPPAVRATAAPRPSCARGETVVFSCPLHNGKQVALCIAKDSKGTPFGQYRYGRAGQASELAWPAAPSTGALEYATEIYSGGGEQQISFARGGVRYTVFSRMVRTNFTEGEPNNPAISDGLVVSRGGRTIATYRCTGDDLMPVQMTPAARYIKQVRGLFIDVGDPR